MNLFKSFTLTWWQGSLFKLALLCLGLAIGSTWPDLFWDWTAFLWVIFLLAGSYVTWIWYRQ